MIVNNVRDDRGRTGRGAFDMRGVRFRCVSARCWRSVLGSHDHGKMLVDVSFSVRGGSLLWLVCRLLPSLTETAMGGRVEGNRHRR